MRDEFEERERSVGDSLAGDEKPSESRNGHARWDSTPRVGTAPADAYSSSSEPYISSLPSAAPEPVRAEEPPTVEQPTSVQQPPTVEDPLRLPEPLVSEARGAAEQPVLVE